MQVCKCGDLLSLIRINIRKRSEEIMWPVIGGGSGQNSIKKARGPFIVLITTECVW